MIFDWPRSPGFSRMSTRRSASLAVIRPPASIIAARISANDHAAGWHALTGSGVTSLASDVQSGVRCFWLMRS